jgi:hypothetical protein
MEYKVMAILSKVIIIVFLLSIFYSLGSALYFLIRHSKGDSTRVVKALTWRIGLSLVLFLFLMFAFAMGWIAPHAVVGG